MKKHLLIILICLVTKTTYSQSYTPFPEDSAQWSIWQQGLDSISLQPYIFSYQLKMIGDTLINGISYNKIYKSYDITYPSNSDSLHCFIRQDTTQKKVFVRYPYYMYSDSSEILLNDFSLQIGDTFNLKLISDGSFHPAILTSSNGGWPTNIGNRKYFDLTFINPWFIGPGCESGCAWIEGIGNYCNLLYTEIVPFECDFPLYHFYSTQCFWQNGVYVTGGVYCDFATGVDENYSLKNEIEVFPNPVISSSRIRFNLNSSITDFVIINAYGQTVKIINCIRNNDVFINANDFPSGIYLLKALKGNRSFLTTKFIVQH